MNPLQRKVQRPLDRKWTATICFSSTRLIQIWCSSIKVSINLLIPFGKVDKVARDVPTSLVDNLSDMSDPSLFDTKSCAGYLKSPKFCLTKKALTNCAWIWEEASVHATHHHSSTCFTPSSIITDHQASAFGKKEGLDTANHQRRFSFEKLKLKLRLKGEIILKDITENYSWLIYTFHGQEAFSVVWWH